MKAILAMTAVLALYSCTAPYALQAEMVNAELIKIDTAFRYSNRPEQMLTWRDDNHINYITYASLSYNFPLGVKMIVLVKR
ncbi:MAG TPA: hypothetical protein VGI82_05790 [Chitinophagaceae bacterium]|jgi:hypothetical protein